MTRMLHTNPSAFTLFSLSIAGMVALILLLLSGEGFSSGSGLGVSEWTAATVAQYALVGGLAYLLDEKDRMMTVRASLYLLVAITLVVPGTTTQIIIAVSYFPSSA